MKRRQCWLVGLVGMILILTATGCGKKDNSQQAGSNEAKLKQGASETLNAAQALASQKKEEFVKTMQTNLDKRQQKMQELNAKSDEAAAEYAKQKAEFDEDLAGANKQLDKVKSAAGDAWQDAQTAAQNAYDQLEEKYKEMAQKFD
jgi:hypothetical protein